MAKRKKKNSDLQSTKKKINDRETRTPLKTGGERRCSGRVGSSVPVPPVTPVLLLLSDTNII